MPQVTGWFNLLGQWAVTAGIDFTLASFLSTIILCGTGGANGGGWVASQSQVGVVEGFLVAAACVDGQLSVVMRCCLQLSISAPAHQLVPSQHCASGYHPSAAAGHRAVALPFFCRCNSLLTFGRPL